MGTPDVRGRSGSASISIGNVLGALPAGLREPLLKSFSKIVRGFRHGRWESAELNGGKLSEVVYTILRGCVDGTFPMAPRKPRNFVDACRALEASSSAFPRSIRVQIPRMLVALYEIRSNRGVGHVGGDIDPNHMDAVAVLHMTKWVMAELVRVFHTVDTETAHDVVDALVEREVPIVWEVRGIRRVLNPKLSRRDATLLLLHSTLAPVSEGELARWVEHPRVAQFRRDVLRPAHRARLLEHDPETALVHLSPLGIKYVEEKLLGQMQ